MIFAYIMFTIHFSHGILILSTNGGATKDEINIVRYEAMFTKEFGELDWKKAVYKAYVALVAAIKEEAARIPGEETTIEFRTETLPENIVEAIGLNSFKLYEYVSFLLKARDGVDVDVLGKTVPLGFRIKLPDFKQDEFLDVLQN